MLANADLGSDPRANEMRRCASCGQPAVRVFHVTRHYVNALPAGRTYEHQCGACGAQFQTLSTWRTIREVFFALVAVPIGLLMLAVGLGGADWWVAPLGLLFVGIAGYFGYKAVRGVLNLRANPPA